MLDFEGNNISDYEQLYYLSRCTKLSHLNLKYTPIARGKKVTGEDVKPTNQACDNIKLYYQKIQRWCGVLEELDDEAIGEDFFQRKIASIQSEAETGADVFGQELS